MNPEPQKEHHWLHKLIGDWTFETECVMGPDQPAIKMSGTETVRSLGGIWTIGDGDGTMGKTIITLGYDPATKRFVGTFVAAITSHLWIYNGSLDASEKILTLDAEGPSFTGEGTSKYKDIIEFVSDDHRILRSQVPGPDGTWKIFMTAHYLRKA